MRRLDCSKIVVPRIYMGARRANIGNQPRKKAAAPSRRRTSRVHPQAAGGAERRRFGRRLVARHDHVQRNGQRGRPERRRDARDYVQRGPVRARTKLRFATVLNWSPDELPDAEARPTHHQHAGASPEPCEPAPFEREGFAQGLREGLVRDGSTGLPVRRRPTAAAALPVDKPRKALQLRLLQVEWARRGVGCRAGRGLAAKLPTRNLSSPL